MGALLACMASMQSDARDADALSLSCVQVLGALAVAVRARRKRAFSDHAGSEYHQ